MSLLPICCPIFSFLLNVRHKLTWISNNLFLKSESLLHWYTLIKQEHSNHEYFNGDLYFCTIVLPPQQDTIAWKPCQENVQYNESSHLGFFNYILVYLFESVTKTYLTLIPNSDTIIGNHAIGNNLSSRSTLMNKSINKNIQ